MDTRTVAMEGKGVMQEIREHLAQGKSAAEVIALGYKAPTVYKVQRGLRGKAPLQGRATVGPVASTPTGPVVQIVQDSEARAKVEELQAANKGLQAELQEVSDWADQLELELDQAKEVALQERTRANGATSSARSLQSRLWDAERTVRTLEGERDRAKGERDQAQTERDRALGERDKAQQELHELRRWLYSRNPCWQLEFRRFLSQPVCTLPTPGRITCTLARPNRSIVVCR